MHAFHLVFLTELKAKSKAEAREQEHRRNLINYSIIGMAYLPTSN